MIAEQAPASARRAPWWLVAILLVVAVGAGFGAGALVWAGDSGEPARAQESPRDDRPTNPDGTCLNVSFNSTDPDPVMRAAAELLREDPRFETVVEVTQEQAFAEFKEIFADQPELVKLARIEAMPAIVRVKVRERDTASQVKTQLVEEFPEADVGEGDCQR